MSEAGLSVLLPRRHEHHRLGRLTGLRVLVHHHRRATAGARVATVRLRRCVLWVGVTGRRRVHLHLGVVRRHSTHVRAVGRLLHHRGSSHRRAWVVHEGSHLRTRGIPYLPRRVVLGHCLWGHTLSETCLSWGGDHGGRIPHLTILKTRRGKDLWRRGGHLHAVVIIHVPSCGPMWALVEMRPVGWTRGGRHARVEGHRVLLRKMRIVGGGAALRRCRRHPAGRFEHLVESLLPV
jgi:hypothetical protein